MSVKGFTRRRFLLTTASSTIVSCASTPDLPIESDIDSSAEFVFRTASICEKTAANILGPFYIENAPVRNDLTIFGDDGVMVSLSGRVVNGDCSKGISGAVIEFWQANPSGQYDNQSSQMRYRCTVQTDKSGYYSLITLLPGHYLNGDAFRPRHIHVKVSDVHRRELLTTQLYFEGDRYLAQDPFKHPSLVMSYSGSDTTSITANDIDFIV
jgi:protocatechuate 3,4-dioxygenase beta subunit